MKKLNIVYEDKEIIIINKESKKLTIATSKHETNTLYREVSDYVKKQYPKNKIFIIHRLDKDTSGLVIFAKNEKIQKYFQDNWSKVKREYLAIVEGYMSQKHNVLKSYLIETKTYDVYPTKDHQKGKLAITEYNVLQQKNNYSLLNINIQTGRRNQIRVQLQEINHPIAGDKKYHASTDPLKRLALHAYKITIPYHNQELVFQTPYPKEFTKLFPDS